jgi:tRNA(Ile)-lysidine synthase
MMNIQIAPGSYVVAVSGGVDSVVLLDVLSKLGGVLLHVVHVDHGIRPDSSDDAEFVRSLATKYQTSYDETRLELGSDASEESARIARYTFLEGICKKYGATLITAHHQDDVLETAIFNMIRGTGRRGLSSLRSSEKTLRPLLAYYKEDIMSYAREHHISWREDSTNQDLYYSRNAIRHLIGTRVGIEWKKSFTEVLGRIAEINSALDQELRNILSYKLRSGQHVLPKRLVSVSDYKIASELTYMYLVVNNVSDINQKMVERVLLLARVGRIGARTDLDKEHVVFSTKRSLRIQKRG